MPRHLRRGIVLLAALAITVAALVVAWGDAPAVLSALGRFPPLLIVPVVLLTVWNYTLRWLRWNYYLRVLSVHGVSKVESALVFFSGFAMGLTPGKSGEVTKSYWLREIVGPDHAPLARTAPIVFAERLVDGIAMLLLATSGLISFQFGALALLGVAALACWYVRLFRIVRCSQRRSYLFLTKPSHSSRSSSGCEGGLSGDRSSTGSMMPRPK